MGPSHEHIPHRYHHSERDYQALPVGEEFHERAECFRHPEAVARQRLKQQRDRHDYEPKRSERRSPDRPILRAPDNKQQRRGQYKGDRRQRAGRKRCRVSLERRQLRRDCGMELDIQ